ncbi:MAG: hypothetical protein ACI9UA_000664 [Pseudoalteromonas tetraodonis]|jgi:hypothetical protein
MNFLNLGTGAFVLGLAAIAGGLYLLQRLRIQYREVEVVTTLFWKQAVEETRARALVRRFRHPLAYLLALAIGALIWLALAEPRPNRDDETDYILLLDGSAGMGWGDRFQRAQALLKEEAGRLPAERRRVYFCGAEARLVLDRGEEAYLLGPRLEQLSPVACPASIERELLTLGKAGAATGVKVLVVGDAPVGDATLDALPDHIVVERLRAENTPVLENNSGIAAIGVAEAASGAFDRVDVMVDVFGRVDPVFVTSLGNSRFEQAPVAEGGVYFWRDIPARGDVLEVKLGGEDPLPDDDGARITLPERSALSVALGEGVNPMFRMLVEADPGLAASESGTQATVAIGAASSDLPAIEIVTGNGISVRFDQAEDRIEAESRFDTAGLERVGRKVSADGGGDGRFQLMVDYQQAAKRTVRIGSDLLGDDYDFVRSSAFPIFVSEAIRWLADASPVPAFAAAGERLPISDQLNIAGAKFAPPQAGDYPTAAGQTLAVSLPAVAPLAADPLETVASASSAGFWPAIASWCILIAIILVGAEWWFFQKGRIP